MTRHAHLCPDREILNSDSLRRCTTRVHSLEAQSISLLMRGSGVQIPLDPHGKARVSVQKSAIVETAMPVGNDTRGSPLRLLPGRRVHLGSIRLSAHSHSRSAFGLFSLASGAGHFCGWCMVTCQCAKYDSTCSQQMTQEDLLCDVCREGCAKISFLESGRTQHISVPTVSETVALFLS